MIIVIKSLRSGTTIRIPIRKYGDIESLADRFPAVKEMEKSSSNPIEILQMFVRYMSHGSHSAWLEDDGYKIMTKEAARAEKLKWAAVKASRLNKSEEDKIQKKAIKDQGIATQVKPEQGALGLVDSPYAKRFVVKEKSRDPMASPYALNFAEMERVSTKHLPKVGPNGEDMYHHTGVHRNNNFHVLSYDKNPYAKGVAGVITGYKDKKNHIRAAFANSTIDQHMETLTSSIQSNTSYQYHPPIVLDSEKHAERGWEKHNDDLYHGMVPDKTLQAPPNTISTWLSFAGAVGDETPRALMKERMKDWDSVDHMNRERSKAISFFNNPNFTTAHREVLYSKIANDVFGLGQYVPRVAVFRHPLSNQTWSSMEFIKGAKPIDPESRKQDLKTIHENGDLFKMAVMNTVLGNNDRHLNNMLKDAAGQVYLIDNGLTFDYGNAVETTPAPHYVHQPREGYSILDEEVPDHVMKWISELDDQKLVESMNDANTPFETIMEAKNRINDAKRWANDVRMLEIDHPQIHKGLKFLLDLMRLRVFDISEEVVNREAKYIYEKMIGGEYYDAMGNLSFDIQGPKTEIKTKLYGDNLDSTAKMVDTDRQKMIEQALIEEEFDPNKITTQK
jgi:hypothetical protein